MAGVAQGGGAATRRVALTFFTDSFNESFFAISARPKKFLGVRRIRDTYATPANWNTLDAFAVDSERWFCSCLPPPASDSNRALFTGSR